MPQKIKLDILTNSEIVNLKTDYESILHDPNLRTSIVLCKKTEGAYNPITGVKNDTWVREQVYAIRSNYSIRDIAAGAGIWKLREQSDSLGTIPLGDVYFLVLESDYLNVASIESEIEESDKLLELRYSVGGVNVTNASTAITGSGTKWSKNAGKGNFIQVNYESDYFELSSVSSNTALTLSSNYTGVTKTNKPYSIYQEYEIIRVDKDPISILRQIHCRRIT